MAYVEYPAWCSAATHKHFLLHTTGRFVEKRVYGHDDLPQPLIHNSFSGMGKVDLILLCCNFVTIKRNYPIGYCKYSMDSCFYYVNRS